MMPRTLLTIALLWASSAVAAAQDGGKIDWKGKNLDPVTPVMDQAVRDGRPLLLFFMLPGDQGSIDLCTGPFSDPAVVDISKQYSCIFIDCTKGKKNAGVAEKLKITQFPKLWLCEPSGVPAAEVTQRDAASMVLLLKEFADHAFGRPGFTDNVDAALAAARQEKAPLMIYFYDDSPASTTMNQSLNAPELKTVRNRFKVAKAPMTKDSVLCTRYDVSRAPTVLILDPLTARPEQKPLARISSSRNPRELLRDLEEALAQFKGADANPAVQASSIPTPTEKLSDDEVDRKFIQARLNLALDYQKQGKKDKAIDVLEDVLQTFPKHVLTKDAKALLEKIRAK